MAAEKKSQWELFNECISPELQAAWEKLDTKPTYEGKMLKSVYVAPAPEPTSVTQKMRTLRKMEHTSDSSRDDSSRDDSSQDESEPFTPSDWIEEGLEIERIQERLRRDVNTQRGLPTPSQALDIGRRCDALQRRRTRHTKDAAIFFMSEQLALYVAQGDSDRDAVAGKPEMGTLALPSRMLRFRKDAHSRSDRALIEVELSKRVNACLKALVDLRTTSQQKALLIQQKQKHVRGEIKNTRVQTMILRLMDRVNLAVWEYRNLREAWISLGAPEAEANWLQPLRDADLSGLTSMLQSDRSTGEGTRQLPWFWTVRSMQVGRREDGPEENDSAMRVEWFRSKS
ncbi:hypothetical protein FS749_004134 [Ceratobasidium sp. UAMH 11750]|nr:hypothetical protein FS749_004134 [Ceratobasidium sp. UAMH 11750]